MTVWLFNDGSSLSLVANGNNSVTHNISSSSTSDTGTYYCIATIDEMNDNSDVYTLFGELFIVIHTFRRMQMCNFHLLLAFVNSKF